jgi:SAM-dependent methyltransferase
VRTVLEVGCGTGHWLARYAGPPDVAAPARQYVGVDLSAGMLAQARVAVSQVPLVRGRAEALPFADASFDRIYCVNALHHFSDRGIFFAEARRLLRTGGALLTVGKDPQGEMDSWWVYDYFPGTLENDRERFARVRTLRGELALAGFTWAESFEADHIEAVVPAADAIAKGLVDRAYTSQLAILSDEDFATGVRRLHEANAAAGGDLQLVTDFRLFATVGRT